MATKSGVNNRGRKSSSYEGAEFINRELTEEERIACKGWEFSDSDAWYWLQKLSDDWYKITFRFDEYNNCSACWLLPDKLDKENSGLILTGRGSSPMKALKQAVYKHTVLFDGIWPRGIDERGKPEIDD